MATGTSPVTSPKTAQPTGQQPGGVPRRTSGGLTQEVASVAFAAQAPQLPQATSSPRSSRTYTTTPPLTEITTALPPHADVKKNLHALVLSFLTGLGNAELAIKMRDNPSIYLTKSVNRLLVNIDVFVKDYKKMQENQAKLGDTTSKKTIARAWAPLLSESGVAKVKKELKKKQMAANVSKLVEEGGAVPLTPESERKEVSLPAQVASKEPVKIAAAKSALKPSVKFEETKRKKPEGKKRAHHKAHRHKKTYCSGSSSNSGSSSE